MSKQVVIETLESLEVKVLRHCFGGKATQQMKKKLGFAINKRKPQ